MGIFSGDDVDLTDDDVRARLAAEDADRERRHAEHAEVSRAMWEAMESARKAAMLAADTLTIPVGELRRLLAIERAARDGDAAALAAALDAPRVRKTWRGGEP